MFPPASFSKLHRIIAAQSVLAFAALVLFVQPIEVNSQSAAASTQPDPLVVPTTSGLVRGITRAKGGAQFLGIPYAEPPLGPLRWHAPVPHKSWKGIRDANAFGSSCSQPLLGGAWNRHDHEHSSEDCLFLNVITPSWPAAAKPLPVMFWIHGGANQGGSGSGSLYNEGTLLDHGVLLVTINYRLGILGFFAHPQLTSESPHYASGNYGLMDQILALRWVHDNIARFGGDPNNITVSGQSAGSIDIGILMTSPLALGLFQKAIGESGAPFFPPLMSFDQAQQAGQQFAASFPALTTENPIDFLRSVPADDLIAKAAHFPWGIPPVGPIVDGWVVPRSPDEVFKAGKEAPIPLLVGVTTREFGDNESPDVLRKSIEDYAGKLAPQALALYGVADGGQGTNDPLYGSAGVQWSADTEFHCPVSTEALWHAAAHHSTFLYEFDHAIPGQEAQGALHSAELPYVFGSFPTSGNISGKFGPIDFRLADLMETYWTNFAKTGDPKVSGDPNSAPVPHWPEFNSAQLYFVFTEDGLGVASTSPFRAPQCDLYREILAESMKHGN